MKKAFALITLTVLMVLIVACQDPSQSPEPSPAITIDPSPSVGPTTSSANKPTDEWLGQWNGPEGTYLLLSKKGDQYEVKIQSLDGPNTYGGVAAGDQVEFERDGKTESIRAGSGQETGMKWLREKKACLIIKEGEGFCRE